MDTTSTDTIVGDSVNENWEESEDDSDPRSDFDHCQQQEKEITGFCDFYFPGRVDFPLLIQP